MSETFKPNGIVYSYHGPLIYEAKILKIHEKNKPYVLNGEDKEEPVEDQKLLEDLYGENTYLLHYQGWNSKWDEWVTIDRLLEYNEENKRVKKELDDMRRKKKPLKKETKNSTPTNDTLVNGQSDNKKRAISDKGSSKKKKDGSKMEIIIPFRNELKYILVDDWDFITRDKQIVDLPSKKPVSVILQDYMKYKLETDQENIKLRQEMVDGLEIYFNKSLSLVLLYKFERLQYLNLIKDGITRTKKFSEIYGLEHLLRLFVSLPGLVAQTSMDSISLGVLINESMEIMEFLTKNLRLYSNQYINTTPAYNSLARS